MSVNSELKGYLDGYQDGYNAHQLERNALAADLLAMHADGAIDLHDWPAAVAFLKSLDVDVPKEGR